MLRAACSRSYQRLRPSSLVIQPLLNNLDLHYNNNNKNNNNYSNDFREQRTGGGFRSTLVTTAHYSSLSFSSFSTTTTTINPPGLLSRNSGPSISWNGRRNFSATTNPTNEGSGVVWTDATTTTGTSEATVDEALERLFADDAGGGPVTDALLDIWEPTWYNVADQAIVVVNFFHHATGLEIGWSIISVTFLLRAGLFPLMVMAQRNSSRMAHLQPQLKAMQKRYTDLKSPTREDQLALKSSMKKLFKQYECNPVKGLLAPLVQIPCFMGMFFGLRKMGDIFPTEMSQGGLFWFPDLTATDPYYVLPFLTFTTFMALTEASKEQMANAGQDPATGQRLLNAMRAMSVIMLPVVFNFHTAMLLYWTTNNILTLTQTKLLDTKAVRSYFGIWERPKPIPGQEVPSLKDQLQKLWKRMQGEPADEAARMKQHNREIETRKRAKERREAMNRER